MASGDAIFSFGKSGRAASERNVVRLRVQVWIGGRAGRGKPYRGPWVNFAMNGLKPGASEAYFETIKELKKQGWNYFKIDTLRHVLYDNYRKNPFYWKSNEQSMEEAFRAVVTGCEA